MRDRRRLVGLGVWSHPDAGFMRERRHAVEIALERVEVDHQGGGVDGVDGIAHAGGRRGGHLRLLETRTVAASIAPPGAGGTGDSRPRARCWPALRGRALRGTSGRQTFITCRPEVDRKSTRLNTS